MARILLVDDDADVLNVLSKAIIAAGHETVTVLRGDAAIDRLRETAYDLMVSDVRMNPMDGVAVLEAARNLRPDMPVIMLTGYSSDAATQKAKKLGAYAYLEKPFGIDELRTTIDQALAESQSRPQA